MADITVDEAIVEAFAKAMWESREARRDGVALGGEEPRAWNAYPGQGEDEFDCGRFEYWRKDHRTLMRDMLTRLASDWNITQKQQA